MLCPKISHVLELGSMRTNKLFKLILLIAFLIVIIAVIITINKATADPQELREAISLFKRGNFRESLRLLESSSAEAGPDVFLLQGHCYLKLSNIKKAQTVFEKAADDDFILSDYARFKLGDIMMREKRFSDAIEEYEALIKIHPKSVLKDKAEIKMARCLIELNQFGDAITFLNKFIEDNPSSPLVDSARINLAVALENYGDVKGAWKTYHDVNLYHPLSPYSRDAIANFKRLEKKYRMPYYSAPAEALFAKGMAFYKKGDFVSASYIFRRLIKTYPYSSITDDALVKLGQCEYRRKLYTASIAHYKEAIKRGKDERDQAQYYMAFSYGKKGDLWKALECLNNVIKYYPSSSLADDAQYYIAYYYEINGYKSRALSEYEKLVSLYPKSELLDNALWRIGKVYYSQKKYSEAFNAFDKAVKENEFGEYAPKCAFWKAKSADRLDWRKTAVEAYKYIIKRFDHTYYSYRAKERLEHWNERFEENNEAEISLLPEPAEIYSPYKGATPVFEQQDLGFTPLSKEEDKEIESAAKEEENISLHFSKYEELMRLGLYEGAVDEASYIARIGDNANKDAARLALNTALFAAGRYKESMRYAEEKCREAIQKGEFESVHPRIWQLAYPRVYYKYVVESSLEFGMDPYLILAVIREESRFDPGVVSWAKAHGLMQIIPSTGRNIARLMGIRPYYRSRLFEPQTNIRMGTYYLSQLLKRFDGNVYLALAAYNGGPNNVKKWWKKKDKEADIDEFVEYIPFYETRRYVQKVMKTYNEYIRIYKGS